MVEVGKTFTFSWGDQRKRGVQLYETLKDSEF